MYDHGIYTIGKHFDKEFVELIDSIPYELKKLHGIAELDPFVLADKYLGMDSVADISIDPNANINGKSPVNFTSEIYKPITKVRSLNIMWKEIKAMHDVELANKCIEMCLNGSLYFNDLVKIDVPYCYSSDTSNWMNNGRPYGWLPGGVPHKLQSFIGQTVEVAMDMSQEHAGAIALPNVLVNCAYYSHYDRLQIKRSVNHLDRLIPMNTPNRKEEIINVIVGFFAHNDEDFLKKKAKVMDMPFTNAAMFLYDKYIEDLLQHLVHVLHNTFRVGGDSIPEFTKLFLKRGGETFYQTIGDFIEEQGLGEIAPGTEALSFDTITGKVEWKPVYATIRHENPNKFVKIKLKTGQEIVVTDNHSMFTVRENGRIELAAPRSNPVNLIVPRKFDVTDELINLEMHNLHGNKDVPENIIFDEHFARFLGHYVANGCISHGSLELSLYNTDLEEWVMSILPILLPSVSFNFTRKGGLTCNVGIDFAEAIVQLCGSGAGSKHVPHYLLDSPDSVIKAFLSGYFECDGWVDRNRICASTISDDLQKGVGLLLLKLGIVYSIRHKITEEKEVYKSVNDAFVTERPDTVITVSGQYKDYFSFIRRDKETKRLKLSAINPHNYCDLEYLRPYIKEVYRDNVRLKSKGAMNITLAIVDELYEDLKNRIMYADLSVTSLTDLRDLADTLLLPHNAFAYYEEEHGWRKYSLREPMGCNNYDNFIHVASLQLEKIKILFEKLSILQNVIPIKVESIEYLPDEKYSYDISVEDNENFLAGDNLFAHNSPFTNVSLFCRESIKKAFEESIYPDWTTPTDLIDEIMHVQEIFARFFSNGSPITGKNYRFPVCTVNLATKSREVPENDEYDQERHFTEEEKALYPNKKYLIKDKEFFKVITRYNAKRGVFNFHRGDKFASCCRLTQSLADLKDKFRADTFGNGGLSLGSDRVVTVNLHNAACEAIIQEKEFKEVVNEYMYYAEILLVAHKKWMKKIIKTGMLKFFNLGWENLNMFFSTYGFTGLWDSFTVLKSYYSTEDIIDLDYEHFAKAVISLMEYNAKESSANNPECAFNVEEIPAENASPKLAAMDNFLYNDCEWYTPVKLLANQLIPLYEDFDMFDRLEVMGRLMDDVSGGTICHFNVDGSMTEESGYRLTAMLIEEYGLVHFAIEIGNTTCVNGHTSVGVHQECPLCKGAIATWTRRIVGYNSDTTDWIEVRREWENLRRRCYHIGD